MTKAEIVTWLSTEFGALLLATPTATIQQVVDNAIRYWNAHSACKYVEMFTAPAENQRVQLSNRFKTVVDVIPNRTTTWIFENHPLWTLLGITVLDNVTTDLILLGEAYRSYRNYMGLKIRWNFEPSDTPATGGYLYVAGLPHETNAIYVVGTKRLFPTDNITNEKILQWILDYSKALLKLTEGNTLRKADIPGVKNDGQALVDEGKAEVEALQKSLSINGRWVCFASRM